MINKQRFLVTGGAGFIGSHLVESLLSDGHEVLVLDNLSTGKRENLPATADLFIDDVRNPDVLKSLMQEVDGCYHLAAVASVDECNRHWQASHETNLVGSINVFDAARLNHTGRKIPVVYASSAAVYGDVQNLPVLEDMRASPISPYGADKLGSEMHARVASLVHKVPTMGFRFFNVYGPKQDPKSPYSGVISIFMEKISRGETVTVYGDGEQSRDFIYVADVIRFLRQGMQKVDAHPRFYNVCTGYQTSILQLADTVMKVTGQISPLEFAPARVGDIKHSRGSPRKAENELGISATISLEEGLRRLWESL